MNGTAGLFLFCLFLAWLFLRARSGGRHVGHAHGLNRQIVARHEAGHVVAARHVGGRRITARVFDDHGWVNGDVAAGIDRVVVAYAGAAAAGTRTGCGFDDALARQELRRVPRRDRARADRQAQAQAGQIVARHRGEIARVQRRLERRGRL